MKIERTKNTLRNAKWGVVQWLVHILFPFAVRTILVHTLSAEYAGISSLFTSILSILSLTELGFSNAIVYSMYKPVAEDDKEKIQALLYIYRKAYRVIGAIILALGLSMLPFLRHLIHGSVPADTNLYILYCIYLFNTVISYFLFAYKSSLLSAYQRVDVISKNTLIANVFLYITQCVVLLTFRNYYVYAIIIPLSTVIQNLLTNHAVTKLFPGYLPRGSISPEEKAELKKNVTGLMIWKIGGATRNTFDSIVISSFIGLVSVAMYNNYFYIINGVNSFLAVLTTSMMAGVGNKIVTAMPEKNYEDFKKFHFLYMWIASWCTVCMMCMYQPFMKIWMGEDLMFPNSIMFLFCYYFIMMKQGDINSVYYQAAGLWWHGKYRSIVEAVLNLTLNIILGKLLGVTGIILATIISYTCVYFYGSKFVFTEYFKNGKLGSFYIDNLFYLLCTGIVGYGSFGLLKWLVGDRQNSLFVLAISLLTCITLPNLCFGIIYSLRKQNRIYMKQFAGELNKRIILSRSK